MKVRQNIQSFDSKPLVRIVPMFYERRHRCCEVYMQHIQILDVTLGILFLAQTV